MKRDSREHGFSDPDSVLCFHFLLGTEPQAPGTEGCQSARIEEHSAEEGPSGRGGGASEEVTVTAQRSPPGAALLGEESRVGFNMGQGFSSLLLNPLTPECKLCVWY